MTSMQLNNVQLSKKLSWLLRHGAQTENLTIQANGYICVADILKHPRYASCFTLSKIQEIVAADAKQRYTLRRNPKTNTFEIRANQGHSLKAVVAEDCLEPILRSTDVPMAVHGTYYRNWQSIKNEGLRCMQRNHVHFACNDKGDGVISGFRQNCQLLIYLDVRKALADKLLLFRSSNNVILCAGVNGCIKTTYFERVMDRKTGETLKF